MFIKARQTFGSGPNRFTAGQLYEVSDQVAELMALANLASRTDALPPHITNFLDRLDAGADKPCMFLPFRGEFGHLVMSHLRLVNFHRAKVKVVCCRPSERVLFPSATSFDHDWTDGLTDRKRIGTMRGRVFDWRDIEKRYPKHFAITAGNLTPAQELIAIEPATRIPFNPIARGLAVDVAIGVRHREIFAERNWPKAHWQRLADALTANGLTFAIVAHRDTSFDLDGQVCHSGDHDTDAAIELLQNCRLYVGQDSGNSHLAATVGARMLLFREEKSGSRDLTGRMSEVNPGCIEVVADGWDDPAAVIRRALSILGAQ